MFAWYAVYTQPLKEWVAKRNLLNQGFDCYLPSYKKFRKHARKVEEVSSPLFPRYMFVGMDLEVTAWRSINGTIGVANLVCFGHSPVPMPSVVLDAIRERENKDGFIEIKAQEYAKGQSLKVVVGPFEELTGLFESMDGDQTPSIARRRQRSLVRESCG